MNSSFAGHPQSATIQLPSDATGARRSLPCLVQRGDSRRLVLETNQPLVPSTALSVEYNDAMFLGEVVARAQSSEDRWEIEVRIEQILTGLQSLMALRAGLLGEAAPQPFAPEPVTARR